MDQKNQQWIYVKRPEGEVTEEHYSLRSAEIRLPGEGEVVLEIDFWSVDPYIRIQQSQYNTWEAPHPLDTVQGSGTVGHVIASKGTQGCL
jgi:NADPH-dependent curcumin reductase CurA